MAASFDSHKVVLNGVPWEWTADGKFVCLGRSSIMFWLNPSLYHLLAPLVAEIGPELASLLIAYESSLGTDADYQSIVTVLGSTFVEGFLAWGASVSACGWGRFELTHFDLPTRRATVRVHEPWELLMHQGTGSAGWGCPFLLGKVIGIFTHALGARCWADERVVSGESPMVEFSLYASERTIAGEIAALRAQQQARKEAELRRLQDELSEKQRTILALSTPVVRIWEGVVLLPLVGSIDASRGQQLMLKLLDAITQNHASHAIIDITGVPFVDTQVANHLVRTVHAARLLGVTCMLVGISAEVAQTLVQLGIDLSQVNTYANLESGLKIALSSVSAGRPTVSRRTR